MGVLSSLFSLTSPLVRIKLGSDFHTGHGWVFALTEGMSFFVCLGAAFLSNFCGVLPRPTKICLAFLRPALCAWRFCVLVPPLRGSSWVLGFGWPEAQCVSSLSLSLSRLLFFCVFFCVCFGAATLFLMPRPLLG